MKDKYLFNKVYEKQFYKIKFKKDIYNRYFNYFFNEELKRILDDNTIVKIADLGCGDGQSEDFLINQLDLNVKDKEFYCFDEATVATNNSKMRGLKKCIFFNEDILKLDNKYRDFFDAVMIVNVIHHLYDLQVIGEAYKILKNGGKLIIIDLPWDNPIMKIEFKIFDTLPLYLKNRLSRGDLLIDGKRPERFYFKKNQLDCAIEKEKFKIINKDYSYLFLFVFFQFEEIFMILGLSQKSFRFIFYPFFLLNYHFEKILLKYKFFQTLSAVYKVVAIKYEK